MILPVLTEHGLPAHINISDVFSICLDGRRIMYITRYNERYYHLMSIDEIFFVVGDDFERSDRKNIINTSMIKKYDSIKRVVYCDDVVTDQSIGVPVNDSKIQEMKRLLGKENDLAEVWWK